jgi:4-amino-4-deoxy-L-arabinose transferase-like glycosyltransferase
MTKEIRPIGKQLLTNNSIMNLLKKPSFSTLCLYILLISILIRLLAAYFIPLMDTTEARYTEIARKMLELGDWITLYHAYGVPFWGKPPLSTWLSASSMALFGVNAFAARLPIFFLSLGIVLLVMKLARTRKSTSLPRITALILFTGLLFYVASAAVMTDMVLTFGVTLSMVSFWYAISQSKEKDWGYLFFIGQAVGLLSKGPLCLIITGFPIAIWGLTQLGIKELWRKLPWISGSLLMLIVVVPWHGLAELKTPGFLNYYILGEHFQRFFVKGWTGDLYGRAHAQPRGFIWIFWLLATLPWSIWFMAILLRQARNWRTIFRSQDGWLFYLLLWTLSPLVIFTTSQNIIWTYPLPGIPAFSLLIGHFISKICDTSLWGKRLFLLSSCLMPSLMLLLIGLSLCIPHTFNKYSQKNVIEEFLALRKDAKSKLLYYDCRYYSAEFYSKDQAISVPDILALQQGLETRDEVFVVMTADKFNTLAQQLNKKLVKIKDYGKMTLFQKMK